MFLLFARQQPLGQHGSDRGERHGKGDDRNQQRGRARWHQARNAGGRKQDEAEFAALRQQEGDANGVVMRRAGRAAENIDNQRLRGHDDRYGDDDEERVVAEHLQLDRQARPQ